MGGPWAEMQTRISKGIGPTKIMKCPGTAVLNTLNVLGNPLWVWVDGWWRLERP
ncbi:hypothetical protein DPMN_175588 [Dreissena polymorpha]|uniref:Uncharacterized protein n=1 Tax=Dreissena polymorpha TaxID=45954 RepID=A0A9D4IJS6_DREPO|nr:hypothetical protein DPMN_175588 [Dreissena polymorpha]